MNRYDVFVPLDVTGKHNGPHFYLRFPTQQKQRLILENSYQMQEKMSR